MLSAKIARLRETFDAWNRGDPFPTPEAWLRFGQELREITFEAAMLELGVDLTVIDVAVEIAKGNSNVVRFPRQQRSKE